jgi:two-component system KDP operon response regulator KdpE
VTSVLVIDDETALLRALRINLTARDYTVTTAADGATGLAAMARHRPDVVIIDLGLPDMDGTEVIRGIRGWSTTPIIVLSARGEEIQKVDALDAGADDYITKPFGMNELLARVRAATRRGTPAVEEPLVATGQFSIDLAAKRVTTTAGAPPRNGSCLKSSPATAADSSPADNSSTTSGVPTTPPKPTICASTSPNYAANSNPTQPTPTT